MHICFISYWGINEGLTQATVIPHVRILAEMPEVHHITLVTVERKRGKDGEWTHPKVSHRTLLTTDALSQKLFDKNKAKRLLDSVHGERAINAVFARTSLAGWLALDFVKAKRIPIIVESFEPHAEYMLDAGVWKRMDPRYVMTKSAERRLKKRSHTLLPVTRRYADYLIAIDAVEPERIKVMPCCVDTEHFAFSSVDRKEVRQRIGVREDAVVAIYTGKKGGIYLDKEALTLMQSARDFYQGHFHLIVLSPQMEEWERDLSQAGFAPEVFTVAFVRQAEVPAWLSAADFAFSLHKPAASMIGISPIKNAEYFANNLPVIMPNGIGDDAFEVEKWNLGVTFSMDEVGRQAMFNRLHPLLMERMTGERIADWASQRRSFEIVRTHYAELVQSLG